MNELKLWYFLPSQNILNGHLKSSDFIQIIVNNIIEKKNGYEVCGSTGVSSILETPITLSGQSNQSNQSTLKTFFIKKDNMDTFFMESQVRKENQMKFIESFLKNS